jgi:hypothetical protein
MNVAKSLAFNWGVTAMSGEAPDPPQDKPAPTGATSPKPEAETGSARFVSAANGFLSFKPGLKTTSIIDIDEAIKIPSEHIERAFINHWDRHANVEINRTHEILRRQAYELSFGEDEKKRIRDSLPGDADVLDVIECFGSQILLENFGRYLARRRKYFRSLSVFAPLSAAVASALVVGVLYYFFRNWLFPASLASSGITLFQMVAPGVIFGAVFAAVGVVATVLGWSTLIADKLKTERTYYAEIVKGSTSRVKSYLSSIQRGFATLSVSAQKQLTDIKKREDNFVGTAKQYVRLIVWFPVRLEMIEAFYRATIDSYMERSAKEVLAADLGIFARRQLRWFALGAVAVATICVFVAGLGNIAAWAVIPVVVAVISFVMAVWPQSERFSSARFIPKDFSGFQFEVFKRRAWGVCVGSLPAAVGAVMLLILHPGLPANIASLHPSPWPLVIVANVAVAGWAILQNNIAWQIYLRRDTRTLYNGNVADTIVLEMNSADWAAFNELRSDQKMAEIYESVFSALQEEKKARR